MSVIFISFFGIFLIDIVFPFVIDYLEMGTIRVISELSEIEKIRAYLRQDLKELNISDEDYYQIELSLLEICINIMRYAYPEEKGDICIRTWQQEGKIFLEIIDWGIPFDPRKAKEPDIKEGIKNKEKVGFGIFLYSKLMDGFDYKRENDQNILTIYKKINEAETQN